ncbi:hypothetical protein EV561_12041 [Rhizobium sp. BK376]|nr:hypothetical protein EV561_12041 [Rhizobium sp. BK376]
MVRVIAWISLATMGFLALAPLRWRPRAIATANVDSLSMFVLLSMLFAFSYPDDRRVVAIFCIVGAIVSEILLLISPRRDPRVNDALLKALGGLTGVVIGAVILQIISFGHR